MNPGHLEVRRASLTDVQPILGIWEPYERDRTANAYVTKRELVDMISEEKPRTAYVVQRGAEISAAFTGRRLLIETGERIVRVDSLAATDEDAERAIYDWLARRPPEYAGGNLIDVWFACKDRPIARDYGFNYERTYQRLDLETLDGVEASPVPDDVDFIAPDDDRARMVDWARVFNEAFAGEWRQARILDIQMRQEVLGDGRYSVGAIDKTGRTVSLVLTRLEDRPNDPLAQPIANVSIVCTDPARMGEGIGEAALREALIRARGGGARSATIRTDLGSRYQSVRMYRRIGFEAVVDFCAWALRL